MTKVVFCYPLANGYITACWRALACQAGIDLSIVSFSSRKEDNIGFPSRIMEGLDHHPLIPEDKENPGKVAALIENLNPDVLFISGWHYRSYRALYSNRRLAHVPIVLLMDNPFRGDLRQFVGKYVLSRILQRVSFLFVTGERSHQLARYWGVPREKIVRGCVSVDYAVLTALCDERAERGAWPRSFLFVGRYVEEKALDVLVNAYRIYRDECQDPWSLRCAGTGPYAHLLKTVSGIEDLGFMDPEDLRACWLDAGCFVISSRFDPWPLVIVEACAAGLPVIATDVCGSTVENVRHLFNGYIASTADARQIADGMAHIHARYAELPEMGHRSRHFAAAYSADMWAERVMEMLRRIKLGRGSCSPNVHAGMVASGKLKMDVSR